MIFINILVYSFMAGLVTGLGALITILIKEPSKKLLSLALGFASGIMIGISTISLIPESMEAGSFTLCFLGFVSGAVFLWLIDVSLPHIHKNETNCDMYMKMGYFIAAGIAFHNLPEGIAIGATNEVSTQLGLYTAISIGIHNIAEGLSIAMPLCMGKVGKIRIIFITTMTGLATLLGTIIGLFMVGVSQGFISFALAFAAGAMIYISSDELIPHSHSVHSHTANMGIVLGIMLALLLK